MMPIAVVLPAPLGPSSATVSPLAIPSATSSSASVSPNRRLTPSKAMAVARAVARTGMGVVAVVVMGPASARDACPRSHGRRDRTVTTVTTGARSSGPRLAR